ncbi:hypothetical protein C0992_006374 [Termitomyces sp. T32_za158]|nr:hypothetical protein C0992_006374 [Termitomyces sp. T32_za158]
MERLNDNIDKVSVIELLKRSSKSSNLVCGGGVGSHFQLPSATKRRTGNMGFCSSAILSYGIILDEEEIINLLKALGRDKDELNHALGSGEFAEAIDDWIQGEGQIEPFCFQVVREYCEGLHYESDNEEGVKLAIIFQFPGEYDPQVEIWGRDAGTAFTTIPLLNNEELMETAKEGFNKLKSTKAFQEAKITVIVPQWILRLDLG